MQRPAGEQRALAPRVVRARCSALLTGVALALACSRGSPGREQAGAKPSATASASAPRLPAVMPSASAKPLPEPVTPELPPQLVACGARQFYRITADTLQAFEIAAQLPPPQIRGSRVARQIARSTLGEPLNVLPAGKGVLVLAQDGTYRYEPGRAEARRYPPVPASAPLEAWTAPSRPDTVRVRAHGDRKLQEYSLAGAASVALDAAPPPPLVARSVVELPEFDGRLFTLLAGGAPLYSTANGLVRHGSTSPPAPLSAVPSLLFGDASAERYWAADASGGLALFEQKPGAQPVFSASVPGVVIDAAVDGARVAVLSMKLEGRAYVPSVTLFSNGKELGRIDTGPSFARRQPEVDLCLIAGRPWVLVGNRRWLQLIDWESRRLLAEW